MREGPTWRWVVFAIFFVLFPIVFHPWWLVIISMALFGLLAFLLHPKKTSTTRDSCLLTRVLKPSL
jgi:chromate transport protein ChrA